MRILIYILCLGFVFSGELEVDGDLKVTGTIENDSLQQVIATQQQQISALQALILQLQAQITLLGQQAGLADCNGVVGGSSVIDECGICDGSGIPEGECDCGGNVLDVCGFCGGDSQVDDCISEIIDIDGNIYDVVIINNQYVMADNLKVTHYRNGEEIPHIISDSDWANINDNNSHGAYSYYSNNETLQDMYGNLYNWYTISDGRGVCPVGWHVPDNGEWTLIVNSLGGIDIAGEKMKDDIYWNGTNESGFSSLPGGRRSGEYGSYSEMGEQGTYWSSTSAGGWLTTSWAQVTSGDHVYISNNDKSGGISIRCIQD